MVDIILHDTLMPDKLYDGEGRGFGEDN